MLELRCPHSTFGGVETVGNLGKLIFHDWKRGGLEEDVGNPGFHL